MEKRREEKRRRIVSTFPLQATLKVTAPDARPGAIQDAKVNLAYAKKPPSNNDATDMDELERKRRSRAQSARRWRLKQQYLREHPNGRLSPTELSRMIAAPDRDPIVPFKPDESLPVHFPTFPLPPVKPKPKPPKQPKAVAARPRLHSPPTQVKGFTPSLSLPFNDIPRQQLLFKMSQNAPVGGFINMPAVPPRQLLHTFPPPAAAHQPLPVQIQGIAMPLPPLPSQASPFQPRPRNPRPASQQTSPEQALLSMKLAQALEQAGVCKIVGNSPITNLPIVVSVNGNSRNSESSSSPEVITIDDSDEEQSENEDDQEGSWTSGRLGDDDFPRYFIGSGMDEDAPPSEYDPLRGPLMEWEDQQSPTMVVMTRTARRCRPDESGSESAASPQPSGSRRRKQHCPTKVG
ncbi:hypothetical protein BV898_13797 [Hypsibius exemplaris]|uniref:Uncharacterized protein n=1 Tax=Hypsibius exemplaris TaxID=2072580 RepID=A0A1W0W9N4_HYPEX|nr:hypothetical protein BV898_13797 [Hypsibius exemplaris]